MPNPQLTYYDLGAQVVAFSTTRHGGCSVGNYAAFNINNYCGDEAAHIAENRRALAGLLGIDDSHIVMPHQVHGTEGSPHNQTVLCDFFPLSEGMGEAFLPMTSRSNFAHSASTSGIPIFLSISSVFILFCDFKGLSNFCQ